VAVNDEVSAREFASRADLLLGVEPRAALTATWETARASASGGSSSPGSSRKVALVPVSWDVDEEAALRRAHEQFRWFCAGWTVTAELPDITTIDAASRYIRPRDVAQLIPCGARVDRVVEAIRPFLVAGFTDIALVQIGGGVQQPFLRAAERELLPALRESLP
jgi:hypothetical protein